MTSLPDALQIVRCGAAGLPDGNEKKHRPEAQLIEARIEGTKLLTLNEIRHRRELA
jgi:hypothetical protein